MAEFKREERFIVIKRKNLRPIDERELNTWLQQNDIQTCECVVVESDWPEYEQVWSMIEARATGSQSALAAKDARIAELELKLAATPSEDGGEVLEVVGHLLLGGYADQVELEDNDIELDMKIVERLQADQLLINGDGVQLPLMTVAQYSRIVAAKDAEIAQLKDQLEHWLSLDKERDTRLQAALDAQPARQVGGDEREARALFEEMALIADDEKCIQILAAALAPAAVVVPEYERNHIGLIAESTLNPWNAALDEVARLNRRAIPEELIEASRRAADILGSQGFAAWDQLAAELRALLGKEGE